MKALDRIPTGYHRHVNGGGLVADTATVPDSVFIDGYTTIGNRAKIGDGATIGDDAKIGDGAFVENDLEIAPGLEIAAHAYVADSTGRNRAPVIADIDRTILDAINESGHSLDMAIWHHVSCGTTHCRGGWAITLAGEAGAKLGSAMGSEGAARAIYAASSPGWTLPNFFASNEDALADMQMRAEASR